MGTQIKVVKLSQTKNDKVVKVEFEQVMDAFDTARGFNNGPKRAWITADASNNTFKEGMVFNKEIKHDVFEEPQYEGHEPFEKTGKYYVSKIV